MKTSGIVLVLTCFSSIGLYLSYRTKACVKNLHEVLDLMKYIKNQIEFFSTPIPDIYDNYSANNKETASFIHDISLYDWEIALKKRSKSLFDEKTVEILKCFGNGLGKSNKEQQLLHCDYYIDLIEKEYEKTEKNAPDKIKITLALCFYAGLMVLILFI